MARSRRLFALAIVLLVGTLTLIAPAAGASDPSSACGLVRATVPVPHHRALADLYDVKVVSGTDAWAVGTYGRYANRTPRRTFPLMEHWDGTKWNSLPMPHTPHAFDEYLTKLAVISPVNIWAVGNATFHQVIDSRPGGLADPPLLTSPFYQKPQGLIDRWNGHSWRRVALPRLDGTTWFTSIDAAGPGDVWVAGMWKASLSASVRPLFLHWDGTTWSVQHPNLFPGQGKTLISDIEATSSTSATVVGQVDAGPAFSFSASLRGGTWTPTTAPYLVRLSGDWGVGGNVNISRGTDEFMALGAYQFDGSSWSDVPTVPLWKDYEDSASEVFSTGVLNLGPSDAWLVGSQRDWDPGAQWRDDNGLGPAYAEHWDGASWTQVRLPWMRPYAAPWLNAVDAQSGTAGLVMMAGTIVPPLGESHALPYLTRSEALIFQGTPCG